ncbi:unnamed protein product [Auanema sp. JU1783]|nr:unnamed protein product [Auanema sp. JU1783]
MSEAFSLSRPVRLPKTTRIKNESFRVNSLRKSSKLRKIPIKRPTVSRFDRSACEEFIASNYDGAVNSPYEEKFSFLNRLLELLLETSPDSLNSHEFFESICSKVIVFIKDDFPLLRAMSFRIIRLCLFTERNLTHLLSVSHIDIYVVRGLDLRVENEVERIEALQLISQLILVYQSSNLKKLIESTKSQKNKQKYAFPRSVMQPVIAIALSAINITGVVDKSGTGDKSSEQVQTNVRKHYHSDDDRLALPCIATFLEFCIYEPDHILNMAGTDWMVRVLTGTAKVSRRIASMVGRVLVHWLDDPDVRLKAQLHLVLEQIFAPLIEFGFFQKNPATVDFGEKEVERIMSNFSYSFLCILRSWSGLIACSAVGSNSTIISSSPLRLLEYLGLGTVENSNLRKIRDIIVDICCEFMDLSYGNSRLNDWNKAVQFYASRTFPDSYESSLKEDFVLAQSEMIMRYSPEHCNHVDLLSSFRAFAFLVLINAGLPQALSRLIVAQPNAPSGIKATLLMADMLNTAPAVIPSSWSTSILSLPTLIQSACEALTNASSVGTKNENFDTQGNKYTFINAQSAELVHHRFDVLNTISIQNASCTPSSDSNYSLFIHIPRKSSSYSGWKNTRSDHQSLMDSCWKGDSLNLEVVSLLFSSLLDDVDTARRVDKVENINTIFVKLLSEVSVTNASHPPWAPESNRILFVCARNAILFSLQLCSDYPSIMQALESYANDFKIALDNLCQGTNIFSVKNLSYGGSMYIFSLIGAYTSHTMGVSILNSKGIFQQ